MGNELTGNVTKGIAAIERYYADIPYQETRSNHQVFSDIVNSYGLIGCQDQAWCATYQAAIELMMVGRDQMLKNWCMTDGYTGYRVFSVRDKFKAAGKTGSTPKVGALVIFKRSHMGRVLSVDAQRKTFECGEGNTSAQRFNRDGDCCAVKTYSWYDTGIECFCYIDYGDDNMTPQKLITATAATYQMAHNLGYRYGDSHATPPCADGIISCDRLIARALYDLGYTDQPAGGITVLNMERYLTKWGFRKVTTEADIQAGDIVLMRQNGTTSPTAAWHAYLVSAVRRSGSTLLIDKYDCGSQERIRALQPFRNVPVNQWPGQKTFYCAFRVSGGRTRTHVTFAPGKLTRNKVTPYAYTATEILKARGYQGRIVDGKHKELALDFKWTTSDMAAMAHYRADRIDRDVYRMGQTGGAGECDIAAWIDLLGHGVPWTLPLIPAEEKEGPAVLLVQEKLRARGIKGKDGKALTLDRQWGENTQYALKKYQKVLKLPETGKVDLKTWESLTGITT